MGTTQGRAFWTHLHSLIHSMYKNCFTTWKNQDPSNLDYIQASLHIWYPNPLNHRFSCSWLLEEQTKLFLNNKRSSVQSAAINVVREAERNLCPDQCHDQEWDFAMEEKLEEAAMDRCAHPQQADAKARQTPTHYGSGGKKTFKDKYVSTWTLFK